MISNVVGVDDLSVFTGAMALLGGLALFLFGMDQMSGG